MLRHTQFNIQVVVYRLSENASNPENLLSSNGNASTNFKIVRSRAKVFFSSHCWNFSLPCHVKTLPIVMRQHTVWFSGSSEMIGWCFVQLRYFLCWFLRLPRVLWTWVVKKSWGQFKTQLGFFLSHDKLIDFIWTRRKLIIPRLDSWYPKVFVITILAWRNWFPKIKQPNEDNPIFKETLFTYTRDESGFQDVEVIT